MKIKNLIFNKFTLVAIFIAVFYQVVMIGIYIGGYKYTADRSNDNRIVYVNQDQAAGKKIVKQIQSALDYRAKTVSSVSEAKDYLRNHDAMLVVKVPKNFTEDLAQGKTAQLKYYYNSAGDSLSANMGKSVATNVNNKINLTFTKEKMQTVLVQAMLASSQAEIQTKAQALVASGQMDSQTALATVQQQYQTTYTQQAQKLATVNNVAGKLTDVNPKSTTKLNLTMAPMMATGAGFIGALIASMILFNLVFKPAFADPQQKWRTLLAMETTGLIISLAIGISASGMLMWINGYSLAVSAYLTLVLTSSAFAGFRILFLISIVMGILGVLIALPLMLLGLITSGTMIPAYMMAPFLQFIRVILPGPSAWQLILNATFNTTAAGNQWFHMGMIALTCLILIILVVMVKYRKPRDPKNNLLANLMN